MQLRLKFIFRIKHIILSLKVNKLLSHSIERESVCAFQLFGHYVCFVSIGNLIVVSVGHIISLLHFYFLVD